MEELIVRCISTISFVGKLYLITKLRNLKVKKVVKFHVHISTVLSCRVMCFTYRIAQVSRDKTFGVRSPCEYVFAKYLRVCTKNV